KIDPNTKDGIFILEVSPWSISSVTDDESKFREANLFLSKLHCVSCKPNFEYLLRLYSEPFISAWSGANTNIKLNKNGWLEITVSMDSVDVANRSQKKIAQYKNDVLPFYRFSENRCSYLAKTIDFLSKHGKVYLVRVPVYHEMLSLENELMPDFDAKMEA